MKAYREERNCFEYVPRKPARYFFARKAALLYCFYDVSTRDKRETLQILNVYKARGSIKRCTFDGAYSVSMHKRL